MIWISVERTTDRLSAMMRSKGKSNDCVGMCRVVGDDLFFFPDGFGNLSVKSELAHTGATASGNKLNQKFNQHEPSLLSGQNHALD